MAEVINDDQDHHADISDLTVALVNREIDDIQSEAGMSGIRGQRESMKNRHDDKARIYEEYLAREQERMRKLEEFCDLTLRENHKLLLDVLSSTKESDLRSLLAIQAKVIEKFLNDKAQEAEERRSQMEFEKLTSQAPRYSKFLYHDTPDNQTNCRLIVPEKSFLSRKDSMNKDRSVSLYGVKGPSYQELDENLIIPLASDQRRIKNASQTLRDHSIQDHYSFNLDRQVASRDTQRWNTVDRRSQKESDNQLIQEDSNNMPDELLEGSPFDEAHHMKAYNLLLFEDNEPHKGIRKSKTEVAFEPPTDEQQEESPFRKMLRVPDYPDMEITHFDTLSKINIANSLSESELRDELQEPTMRDETMQYMQSKIEKEESRASEYLDKMKHLREYYSNKVIDNKSGVRTTVNSPVLAKAFRQRSSQKQVPLKLELNSDKPNIFQELNYNQFLQDKNSQVRLPEKKNMTELFTKNPERQALHKSFQHILRPKEPKLIKKVSKQEIHAKNTHYNSIIKNKKSINPKVSRASPAKSIYNDDHTKSQGICYNMPASARHNLGKSEEIRRTSLWPNHFNPFSEAEPTCDKFSRLKVNNYSFHIHY